MSSTPDPKRDHKTDKRASDRAPAKPDSPRPAQPGETGGPAWPEPTRYGDWERAGRVSDF